MGESIEVVYDPSDPKYPLTARINDGFGLWMAAGLLGALGVGFAGTALFCRFLYLKGGEYPARNPSGDPADGYDF